MLLGAEGSSARGLELLLPLLLRLLLRLEEAVAAAALAAAEEEDELDDFLGDRVIRKMAAGSWLPIDTRRMSTMSVNLGVECGTVWCTVCGALLELEGTISLTSGGLLCWSSVWKNTR